MPQRTKSMDQKIPAELSKVITIRDIDRELFEQFVSLTRTWGKNTGEIFSNILSNFLENGGSSIYMPAFEKRLNNCKWKHLEIIENVDELLIQKKDLVSVPEDVKFYLNNIKKLFFDDDIDSKTLLKYIYRIKNSTTNQPDSVKKIPFLSLLQNYSEYSVNKRKVKDVTIRNVIDQIWNDFKVFCQLNSSNIGILINQILWDIIPEMEITQILLSKIKEPARNAYLISSQKEISISHADLLEIGTKKVLFHRIEQLNFLEDISSELFMEKIVGIYNCKTVSFPKNFSKLLKLSRVKQYPSSS